MKPYYQDKWVTIYHGDCREILPTLDIKVDLVLTDPPYGIGADKKNAHSSIRDNDKWFDAWDYMQQEAVKQLLAIGNNHAIWGGNYYSDILPPSSAWLAWIKPEYDTGFSLADMELCWTDGMFAARAKLFCRRDGHNHPTQKPEAVIDWTLSFFPNAKLILDPFLGSDTTCYCAKKLNRYSIGIEISEKYCEIAAKRCSQEVMELKI